MYTPKQGDIIFTLIELNKVKLKKKENNKIKTEIIV